MIKHGHDGTVYTRQTIRYFTFGTAKILSIPCILQRLIRYFYHGSYTVNQILEKTKKNNGFHLGWPGQFFKGDGKFHCKMESIMEIYIRLLASF